MDSKTSHVFTALASCGVGVAATLGIGKWSGGISPENAAGTASPPITLVLGSDRPGLEGVAIDDPRISFRQLTAIAGKLAAQDPEAAVRRAASIPGHDNREAYLGEALRAWGEQDGPAAALFAQGHFQGERLTDALYYIADGWAEADPAGAAAWFSEHTSGPVLDDALWEVLESWGRKDPLAALAWSADLDDYVKSATMEGLAEGWGAVDPEAAAAAGMEMLGTEHGRDFLVSVATQWAGSDPAKAAEWAAGLRDESLRAAVVNELGSVWSETAPEKAAEWAAAIADPGSRHAAETGIAIGWAGHDPGGALEWALATIQDTDQLDEMAGDVVFNWGNADPRGMAQWLERREPGLGTDRILKSFSGLLMGEDPETAIAWASRIADPALREEQVRQLAEILVRDFGDEGRRAIQRYQVPEELKREFAPATE